MAYKNIRIIMIASFLCSSGGRTLEGESPEAGVTEEDLARYRVTLYAEAEYFPLDELTTIDGEPYNPETLQGSYALLNLGASWCPFCGKEKPTLERLKDNNTIKVLAIFLGEETGVVREHLQSNNYSFNAVITETKSGTAKRRSEYWDMCLQRKRIESSAI
jgi:thiol-disulfide isomerase/thioredoxin